ncbi:hypothetical protein [Salinarimonas soli]|uniref:Uncharacterized protein n=1 Tax=Salinarimonas soli TaxID=1638099 RepID=A0A5B2V9E2_9HYPH|nr:hypothetical protein [Salinarimonas soli]KAA2235456.1 hypothetical protein F0L46_19735 [Salinarimonas soli]
MFEAGREYTFRMVEEEGECTFTAEVAEVALPLIKLASFMGSPERIINIGSLNFVSAEIRPFRTAEAKAESRRAWDGLINTGADEA